MYPNWLTVEYANTFLMSVWTNARSAAITMVIPPMMTMKFAPDPRILRPSKNTGYTRATRNTPATTMVLECSKELTGVGPAIASGNQVCSGNWPLLPIAAMNKATAPTVIAAELGSPESAHDDKPRIEKPETPSVFVVQSFAAKYKTAVPVSKPISPVRVVKNALRAARLFAPSSHQCPINMNEHRPMISQPRMSWIMFSATTMLSMPAENNVRDAKKCVYRRSPRRYSSE